MRPQPWPDSVCIGPFSVFFQVTSHGLTNKNEKKGGRDAHCSLACAETASANYILLRLHCVMGVFGKLELDKFSAKDETLMLSWLF